MAEQLTTSESETRTSRRGPAALRHRGFRQLSTAWVFTNLADSALYLMVAVWVKDLTGSNGAAGFVFAALGLATFLAPCLGQLAARVSRKWLLVAGNAVMTAVVLSLVLVRDAGDVWLVYAVTMVYGAMGFLTAAAQSGLVRDLLEDDELAGGNGLLATVDQTFRLLSPLVGTALYVAAGPRAVVLVTAACFAVTAVLLARLEVVETPREPTADIRFGTELAAGLHHVRRTAPLGALTFALAVLAGLTAARLIARVGAAGAVAAGLGLMALGMLPFVLIGLLALPTAAALAGAAAGLVLVGLGAPWAVVAFVTIRQQLTPPRLQVRVAAPTNIALHLPQTLAPMLAAPVDGAVDYRLLVAVTIGATVLAGAHALRTRLTTG